ncbi:enoyl-CoA hydratase-related protein [Alicyclobacillus fastidiosus]|uniref:Enoyl-CoA hydratase-related protein n=1 Tax=Alicyclobacillus fastidiosus TaxID=392011 RepID=A0ABY6ZA07_9BACL|nr:enoyl-CoA hydratase-related protein [Alicyclobacillus fastidiosus]WAH39713.1 enoyl-CoA hydratase-related protein [Alicyclobacillus fastidiosus]GMA60936.1 enoyl-CoA hydratase [Alicyclobacillus fastidiosus]
MYETILLERSQSIGIVTLNRPNKLNACTSTMHRELVDVLEALDQDDAVRAVVLTGSGRAFCAGQDLGVTKQGPIDYEEALKRGYNRVIRSLTHLEKPVIAAVNGVAAGAGVALALACDYKVAADDASFVQAFVHIGLVPDSGCTWLLPRHVGLARAMELAMFGDKLDANEAETIGLINRVVPRDTLLAEAFEIAQRLASLPTRAIGLMKRAFYDGLESSLSDSLDREAHIQQLASQTADHQEGIAAFLEKRRPTFRGM